MKKSDETKLLAEVIKTALIPEQSEEVLPEDNGGLFHVYEKDGDYIAIEFPRKRNSRLPNVKITGFAGKNSKVPSILSSYLATALKVDVKKGYKQYFYSGSLQQKPFTIYVFSNKATKPYRGSGVLHLERPIKILGAGKSELMERKIKVPTQVQKKL